MSKILIVTALENELRRNRLPSHLNIVYCGVGKVNAVVNTIKAISQFRPNMILNYGTAGKVSSNISGILPVSKVVQRDMNAQPLAPRGMTPFCSRPHEYYSGRDGYICGSGDSFVTSHDPWLLTQKIDLVDMELFGIAAVAYDNKLPWHSFKYITDDANESSGSDWASRVSYGEDLFIEALKQFK
nr:5'-methylthioadenosine nucleosidase [Polynucleobacter sp. MWH-UH2A]